MRVFGIGATAADVVAILRRGPSGWSHLGRWDIDTRSYEPGSWLHGTLYPQRCDLGPPDVGEVWEHDLAPMGPDGGAPPVQAWNW